MPRFFFHTEYGHTKRDEAGTLLPDVETAKAEAARLMGKMLSQSPQEFWKDGQLRINVENEQGLVLFTVTTFATESATLIRARAR
jgi:hypothetical protein